MKQVYNGKRNRLYPGDLLLFGEACIWLTLASLLRIIVPFKWFAPVFGKLQENEPEVLQKKRDELVVAIALAINRGSRHLPFKCKCLVQAIAANVMLKIRKMKSTVYLGVSKDNENELIAHAWVRCGKFFVCGAKERRGHKIIAIYS